MRKFLKLVKTVCSLFLAALCGIFLYALFRSPAFSGGTAHTYYYGDSAAEMTAGDGAFPLFHAVKGESVVYDGDLYEVLKARFHAELLFSEEACGIVNYYLYSPQMKESVLLGGKSVNLHIAVGRENTVIGTPLIFGGY